MSRYDLITEERRGALGLAYAEASYVAELGDDRCQECWPHPAHEGRCTVRVDLSGVVDERTRMMRSGAQRVQCVCGGSEEGR